MLTLHHLKMGRSRFTMVERGQVARAGTTYSYSTVSCILGCTTVGRYVRAHSEPNLPPPRLGRPPRLAQDDLALVGHALCEHRHVTPPNLDPLIKEMGLVISESTLRRVMKKLGLKRYIAQTKPFVDQRARDLRLDYANAHVSDGIDAWRRTIFCDESILRTNGRLRTWVTRLPGEESLPECLAPRLFSARKTVMVWGAIWYGGRSDLHRFERTEDSGPRGGVTAVDYCNQITSGQLESIFKDMRTNWRGYGAPRILEDNCRVHTAPANRDYGRKKRFIYLDYPPYSPDLNPIENAWSLLKRKLAAVIPRPTTPDSLFLEAQRIWHTIPQQHFDHMVDSMGGRCQRLVQDNTASLT